jgi:choline dehydrogenase
MHRNIMRRRDCAQIAIQSISPQPRLLSTARLLPGEGAGIEDCLRNTAETTSYPACSVAMGSEPDSPLDEKLRVRGVDNLRVAAASALREIPRANTNAPSIMVGERCADFLLAQ